MEFKNLITTLDRGILTIKLNRPKRKNAISIETMKEITKALTCTATNEGVDFVVLTGEGEFYSSGMDMQTISKMESNTQNESISDLMTIGRTFVASFIDFPKLLIAIVNGPAIGIAFTTLSLCDIVYCSTNAYFWAPFTHHGLNAEGCSSYLFPKSMGNVKANEVLQFGKKLTAWEAKENNFVTQVFKPEELESVVWSKIHKLHDEISAQSVIVNKQLTRTWERPILHEVNRAEWKALESRIMSEDFVNWVIKFMNRKNRYSKL